MFEKAQGTTLLILEISTLSGVFSVYKEVPKVWIKLYVASCQKGIFFVGFSGKC